MTVQAVELDWHLNSLSLDWAPAMYLLCLCLRGLAGTELSCGRDRCKCKVTIEIKLHMRRPWREIRKDFTAGVAYKQRLAWDKFLWIEQRWKKYSSRGHMQSHRWLKKQQADLYGCCKDYAEIDLTKCSQKCRQKLDVQESFKSKGV